MFSSVVHVIVLAHVRARPVVHSWDARRQTPTKIGASKAPIAATTASDAVPGHPVSIRLNEFRSTYRDGGENASSLAVVTRPNRSRVRTYSTLPCQPINSHDTPASTTAPPRNPAIARHRRPTASM